MKIRFIKAIIRWLWKNHEKVFRAVMKDEIKQHIHKNPPKKNNIEVIKAVQAALGGVP